MVIMLRPQMVASRALPGINAKPLGFVDKPRVIEVTREAALAARGTRRLAVMQRVGPH